jgi:hypothetical protein
VVTIASVAIGGGGGVCGGNGDGVVGGKAGGSSFGG